MRTLTISLLLAACSTEATVGKTVGSSEPTYSQVALVPTSPRQGVDLLFVIDDSVGAEGMQPALQDAFPDFLQTLNALPSGMPDLHIGVISTDLGTRGALDPEPGPDIGAEPGACIGDGSAGNLLGNSSVTGSFISDLDGGNGTRSTNYTGTLAEAFTSISSLGGTGCGIEQPLQAAVRALDGNPANAGFLRDDASLAVIVLASEDDCSLARSALLGPDMNTLGPLVSFRCTRFGVTCDDGGETTDAMTELGVKHGCHANESLAYLTSVEDTAAFIQSLKPDRRDVLFAAIADDASSLEVEMRPIPDSSDSTPALKHGCSLQENGEQVIDPAIRIKDHASHYARSYLGNACAGSIHDAAVGVARAINGMRGDACLTRDIHLPADCLTFDTHADGSETPLPQCDASSTGDCYHLVADPGCLGQGLRLHVTRVTPPSADTMVALRCKL
jgi:hypothetical protein